MDMSMSTLSILVKNIQNLKGRNRVLLRYKLLTKINKKFYLFYSSGV